MSVAFHPVIPSLILAGTFNGKFMEFYLFQLVYFYKKWGKSRHCLAIQVYLRISLKTFPCKI